MKSKTHKYQKSVDSLELLLIVRGVLILLAILSIAIAMTVTLETLLLFYSVLAIIIAINIFAFLFFRNVDFFKDFSLPKIKVSQIRNLKDWILHLLGGITLTSSNHLRKYPELSVIKIILKKKGEEVYAISLLTAMLSLLYFLVAQFVKSANLSTEKGIVPALLLGFGVLASINQFLMEYRLKKGFYGKNKYEAMDIINFVRKNSGSINFGDRGKPKPLMKREDLEDIKLKIRHSGVVEAPTG
ncbi:hypothetical protein CSB45_11740 [candidate division KSB3 bacterium]|uniref:Uncharacterized protein n=1 Tax=candidate division KSB3 bacterium TaxID=2044937 RepID=A0A2G6E3L4_9BACT|nr:MAG: hypothetical protein CSB45_11740 [candidate division KSB3 bacterium]PIE29273.1 MAG: hypothetical protein CSA57_09710 [candidate division KSB3 bacterium]